MGLFLDVKTVPALKDQKNVQAMASAALHRQCGFDRVLAALKEYRLDCSNGTVHIAPKDAFLHDKCKWILD